MIKVYYALVSDDVPQNLVPKLGRLLERYIAILDYENVFKDWLQRTSDYEPTVVTGPKGKVAVIQVALDVLPAEQIRKILKSESAANWLTKVSRAVIKNTPIKVIVKLLQKLGLYDKFTTSIVLGKVAFVILTSEDMKAMNFTSPVDFIKLFKLGWNDFLVVDEEHGIVILVSRKSPKVFVINLRDVENLIKDDKITVENVFSQLTKKSMPKAKFFAQFTQQ